MHFEDRPIGSVPAAVVPLLASLDWTGTSDVSERVVTAESSMPPLKPTMIFLNTGDGAGGGADAGMAGAARRSRCDTA